MSNAVEKIYDILLQQAIGFANSKILTIKRFFGSAEEFFNAGYGEWVYCGCFSRAELSKLSSADMVTAKNIVKSCEKNNISVLSIWDSEYPDILRKIYNPPSVLYYKGEIPKNDVKIAIVGTRKSTDSGYKIAEEFSFNLAKYGITVVSGGALGIDSAAHKGTIRAGGVGVCVLGCGINSPYLLSNKGMRDAISEKGALISEFPPDFVAKPYTFPMRNRIISGLSLGTVVVEADVRSGALITANYAAEQNRDVFAVPGSPLNNNSKGTNELLKNGAIPVTSVDDIIDQYFYSDGSPKDFLCDINVPNTTFEFIKPTEKKAIKENAELKSSDTDNNISVSAILSEVSDSARLIYELIKENKQIIIDDICLKANLNIMDVQFALTELEINDLIISCPGRYFEIK